MHLVPGGVHCPDLLTKEGAANEGVKKVQDEEIAQIKAWVEEYYTEKGKKRAV